MARVTDLRTTHGSRPGRSDDEVMEELRRSTWRALQGEPSWLYVAAGDSYLLGGDHWRWARAELGRTVADAFDGWVVLGEPAIERFVAPRVVPGSGGAALHVAVDRRWLSGAHAVEVDVAFDDDACGSWHLTYATAEGPSQVGPIRCTGTGAVRTARIPLPDAHFTAALAGAADLGVVPDTAAPVQVRFLRVVRR